MIGRKRGPELLAELVELYGREVAGAMLEEALEAERPAEVLAEYLAEFWRASQAEVTPDRRERGSRGRLPAWILTRDEDTPELLTEGLE